MAVILSSSAWANCEGVESDAIIEAGNIFEIHDLLRDYGVLTEVDGDVANYIEYLQVSTKGTSEINLFANYLSKSYRGLTIRIDANHHARGSYLANENVIVLGRRFVRDLVAEKALGDISTTLRHELVHARIFLRILVGRPTLFDGVLLADQGFGDGLGIYRDKMSFQEFATFGWQAFYHLRQARRALNEGRSPDGHLKRVHNRINYINGFLQRRLKHMNELAPQIEKGEFSVEIEPPEGQLVLVELIPKHTNVPFAFHTTTAFLKLDGATQRQKAVEMFRQVHGKNDVFIELNRKFQAMSQEIGSREFNLDMDFSGFRREFTTLVP